MARPYGELVEFVGLCDINPKRVEVGKQMIGVVCPTFTDFDRMMKDTKPEIVIVTTKDSTHDQFIIRSMDMGCDVITEKPMTTDEKKCQAILDAEKKYGARRSPVTFNYRYSAIAEKVKEILLSGAIGPVTGVDFHWYLDVQHGADYFAAGTCLQGEFRIALGLQSYAPFRPHQLGARSRSGRGHGFRRVEELRSNGKPAQNCRPCSNKTDCKFYWDMTRSQQLMKLYADCEVGGRLPARRLRLPRRHQHLGHDDGQREIFQRRVDELFAQHIHAIRRLPPWPSTEWADWTSGHTSASRGRLRDRRGSGDEKLRQVGIDRNEDRPGTFRHGPEIEGYDLQTRHPRPVEQQRAGSRAGAMSLLTGVAAMRSIEQVSR